MKILIAIGFAALFLSSCKLYKNKEKEFLKQDSVWQYQWKAENRQSTQSKSENISSEVLEQTLRVNADGPFRWHPDSGLMAGAGHLVFTLQQSKEVQTAQQSSKVAEEKQKGKESVMVQKKMKSSVKNKTAEVKQGGVWIFCLVFFFLMGLLFLRKIKIF